MNNAIFETGVRLTWLHDVVCVHTPDGDIEGKGIYRSGIVRSTTPHTVNLDIETESGGFKQERIAKVILASNVTDPAMAEAIKASIGVDDKPIDTKLYSVYALSDPRTTIVHYVGISKNVEQRYRQHCTCSGGNLQKNLWIIQLLQNNQLPTLTILETVQGSKLAREREKVWIQHYLDLGYQLTNWNENEQARNGGTRIDDPALEALFQEEMMRRYEQ